MGPIAYGDSYGGVAQNALQLDAARDARYFQSLADERARVAQGQQYDIQQQQLNQGRAEAQARMAQSLAEFQSTNQLQQQSLAQQAYEAERNRQNELAVTQLRVSPYQDRLGARDRLQVYNQVWNGINNGSIQTPQDLESSSAGVLAPDDIARLTVALQGAQSKMSNAFQTQQTAAGRFNSDFQGQMGPYLQGYQQAQQQVQSAPATFSDAPWYQQMGAIASLGMYHPKTQAYYAENPSANLPPQIPAYENRLNQFEQGLQKNRAAANLRFDPTNPQQPFSPSMAMPPSFGSQAPNAPAYSPSTALPPLSSAGTNGMSDGWQNVGGYEVAPDVVQKMEAARVAAGDNPSDQRAAVHSVLQSAMADGSNRVRPATQAAPTAMPVIPPLSDDMGTNSGESPYQNDLGLAVDSAQS